MLHANDNNPNISEKFADFHAQNPRVYELIKAYTFEAIGSGLKRYSIQGVIERVRWQTSIETHGDDYKLNNNYAPFYARMFMEDFPEHQGFFRTRAYAPRARRAA